MKSACAGNKWCGAAWACCIFHQIPPDFLVHASLQQQHLLWGECDDEETSAVETSCLTSRVAPVWTAVLPLTAWIMRGVQLLTVSDVDSLLVGNYPEPWHRWYLHKAGRGLKSEARRLRLPRNYGRAGTVVTTVMSLTLHVLSYVVSLITDKVVKEFYFTTRCIFFFGLRIQTSFIRITVT